MKYIHIVAVHNVLGIGGVGSVISDLCPQMVKEGVSVYILSLFKKDDMDYSAEYEWAEKNKVGLLYAQEGSNAIQAIVGTRRLIKDLAKNDDVCIYMHLKWGVLSGVLSTLFVKRIKRVEVYHSGYMNYKLQATISKPFIHRYIAVSEDARQQLINRYKIDGNKIEVIHNGVDIFSIREVKSSEKYDFNYLMSAGRLSFEKGFLTSIEAFSSLYNDSILDNYRYIMLGDGPQLEEARSIATENVEFKGRVSRNDVLDYIRCSKAVVLPSLWEGNSIVLLEILAVGKAVVVSDIPSFREVLEFSELTENETYRRERFGFVFKTDSVQGCKNAIREICGLDNDKLLEMDNYVYKLAEAFSVQNQAKKYIACLQNC